MAEALPKQEASRLADRWKRSLAAIGIYAVAPGAKLDTPQADGARIRSVSPGGDPETPENHDDAERRLDANPIAIDRVGRGLDEMFKGMIDLRVPTEWSPDSEELELIDLLVLPADERDVYLDRRAPLPDGYKTPADGAVGT